MSLSIPAFHVSDISKVDGVGDVFIASRKDAASSGVFNVRVGVHFNPAVDPYPTGTLSIKVDLSDGAKGVFTATSVELINSYGKHNPTVYLTGRCDGDAAGAGKGLRYWLMIADNQPGTDAKAGGDVVGFAIHDNTGARVAYGTGPLKSGAFTVAPK
jgi:hypothetical protein